MHDTKCYIVQGRGRTLIKTESSSGIRYYNHI